MGYEYYVINETKKEIFGGFKVSEMNQDAFTLYFVDNQGDTIRLVGEENGLLREVSHYVFHLKQPHPIWRLLSWDREPANGVV